MPTRTDVQTDVHFVPVDSDSPTRKLAITLIYQCEWCSYLAQTYSLAAPFFRFHIRPKPTIAVMGLRAIGCL